jgi:hypothetical protein
MDSCGIPLTEYYTNLPSTLIPLTCHMAAFHCSANQSRDRPGSRAIEELRRRSVIVPRLPVLERLCTETALRAQRQLFATLSANLTDKQRRQLDALLEPHEDRQLSVLAWLRSPSGVPSPRNILKEIRSMVEHFKAVPDFRGRFESYEPPLIWRTRNLKVK